MFADCCWVYNNIHFENASWLVDLYIRFIYTFDPLLKLTASLGRNAAASWHTFNIKISLAITRAEDPKSMIAEEWSEWGRKASPYIIYIYVHCRYIHNYR